MITISNEQLTVKIASKGAEMQSIQHRQHELEYLWNGDPAYWNRHAPILFPIVGQLKDDTYFFEGKAYHLPRHGFARDKDFAAAQHSDTKVTFTLHSDDESRAAYPFDFVLQVHYELNGANIKVTYEVANAGNEAMYFSIGAHPAFNVPLVKGTAYTDYYLQFDQQEAATRCTLENNLIASHTLPFSQNPVPLTHELFYKDALVFKDLKAKELSLKTTLSLHGVTVNFSEFSYLGVWSAKDAPFVCVEPWQGIADTVTHNQQLVEKEGIVALGSGDRWMSGWRVDVY